jgi:hypothetical protein
MYARQELASENSSGRHHSLSRYRHAVEAPFQQKALMRLACIADPPEANDGNLPLHRAFSCISCTRCSLTQVNGSTPVCIG